MVSHYVHKTFLIPNANTVEFLMYVLCIENIVETYCKLTQATEELYKYNEQSNSTP